MSTKWKWAIEILAVLAGLGAAIIGAFVTKSFSIPILGLFSAWALWSLMDDAYLKRDLGLPLCLMGWGTYAVTVVIYNIGQGWPELLYWVLMSIFVALSVACMVFGFMTQVTALMPLDSGRAAKLAKDPKFPGPIKLDAKMGFNTPFMDEQMRIVEVAQGTVVVMLFEAVWTGHVWVVAQVLKWLSPMILGYLDQAVLMIHQTIK